MEYGIRFRPRRVGQCHPTRRLARCPQDAIGLVAFLRTYAEITTGLGVGGILQPAEQTWTAPYESDWAIAVGDFSESEVASAVLSFTEITLAAGTGGPTGSGQTGGHGAMFADVDEDSREEIVP